MPNPPLVSIIIATYNWSGVLRHAIESILGQTFQDFEILIMGDGCTDDSAEVVASFNDPRIRWHNLPQNSGNQSIPNNTGLQLARGQYIAYHGHDDIWFPTHLQLLVDALQKNDADLAHSIAVMIGPPGSGLRIITGISATGRFFPELFLPPSSIMHTRAVIEQSGPWREYRTIQLPPDKEFVLRIWNCRQKFVSVPQLTVFKFNSAWRPNSYVEKPNHEQADYIRRIRTDPNFLADELLAIATAYVVNNTKSPIKLRFDPQDMPPGWLVEQYRSHRGLKPLQPINPNPSVTFPSRLFRKSKKGLHRIFKSLARRLDTP